MPAQLTRNFFCAILITVVNGKSCSIQDGSQANSGSCTCGASGAFCTLASTGLYCHGDSSLCAGPPCSVQDGSSFNDGICKCGTVTCTAATGLICYATTGVGSW